MQKLTFSSNLSKMNNHMNCSKYETCAILQDANLNSGADAQAGLRLCCSQTSEKRFSRVGAHILYKQFHRLYWTHQQLLQPLYHFARLCCVYTIGNLNFCKTEKKHIGRIMFPHVPEPRSHTHTFLTTLRLLFG